MSVNSTGSSATSEAGAVEVTLKVGQNKYLPATPTSTGPPGRAEMHAIIEVGVSDGGRGQASGRREDTGAALAEVLIVDTSKSMLHPETKLHAAKDATVAAIRLLPDGTPFAVLSGRFDATVVHPGSGTEALAVADPRERESAEYAVRMLDADGGTAIGPWLDLARRLLHGQDAPVKHVLLLTDGRNEHDDRTDKRLEKVLRACDGQFICDAWGIGDGWDAEVLLSVADQLHGHAAAVRDEAELPSAYEELMDRLLGTALPEVRIRLVPTQGTEIREVKQVVPSEQTLRPAGAEPEARGTEYVTRGWADETRHYQVVLAADPAGRELGEDLQLAAVELLVPETGSPVRLPVPQPILVNWTDNPDDVSRPHPGVARHQLYQQSYEAVAEAYRAWLRGAEGRARASAELTRALSLADRLGDTRLRDELLRVADRDASPPHEVHVRDGLKHVDWQHLILSSSVTTPPEQAEAPGHTPAGPRDPGPAGDGGGELVRCPHCEWLGPAGSRYCGGDCGRPLGEPA
ncbi:VWA domain-containing protein [Streptomyces sp. NPDC020298]|uniref:VWA domain-containing protein n=1 Tax=unclassified Streptomyces TaxID=2593676 RepID=UPI0033FEFDD8